MVLCWESDFLLCSKGDQHQLRRDLEEILVIPMEKKIAKFKLGKYKILPTKPNFFFSEHFSCLTCMYVYVPVCVCMFVYSYVCAHLHITG